MKRGAITAAWLFVACGHGSDAPVDSAAGGGGSGSTSTSASTSAAGPSSWSVSETGWGRVRAGMSLADARTALGVQLPEPRSRECDHVRPPGVSGVLLMAVEGRIARVDVTDSTVATEAGARIGDTEARINQLYRGRVRTSPHKYTDGRYLIVRRGASADSVYRIVFETDGRRVTRYRSGRMPEVEWVEGCS